MARSPAAADGLRIAACRNVAEQDTEAGAGADEAGHGEARADEPGGVERIAP